MKRGKTKFLIFILIASSLLMIIGELGVDINILERRINQQISDIRAEHLEVCLKMKFCREVDGLQQKEIGLCNRAEKINVATNVIQQHRHVKSRFDSLMASYSETFMHNMMIINKIHLLRDKLDGKIHLGHVNEFLYSSLPCEHTELLINGKMNEVDKGIIIQMGEEKTEIVFARYKFDQEKMKVETTFVKRTIDW